MKRPIYLVIVFFYFGLQLLFMQFRIIALEKRVSQIQDSFIDYATNVNKFMANTNTSLKATQDTIKSQDDINASVLGFIKYQTERRP